MAIALTYLESSPEAPRNSVSIIDRYGNVAMTYAKVHTCDFSMEALCSPGDGFHVCDLDTQEGSVKLGAMICYDREFPESARILMLQGAEIIVIPNSSKIDRHRLRQLEARAFENMVGVAMANYPGPEMGHSTAFDGMAYTEDGRPRSMLVVEAGEMEGVYVATFHLDALRTYRARQTWGNAHRKPSSYSELIANRVDPVFFRKDARR